MVSANLVVNISLIISKKKYLDKNLLAMTEVMI